MTFSDDSNLICLLLIELLGVIGVGLVVLGEFLVVHIDPLTKVFLLIVALFIVFFSEVGRANIGKSKYAEFNLNVFLVVSMFLVAFYAMILLGAL